MVEQGIAVAGVLSAGWRMEPLSCLYSGVLRRSLRILKWNLVYVGFASILDGWMDGWMNGWMTAGLFGSS